VPGDGARAAVQELGEVVDRAVADRRPHLIDRHRHVGRVVGQPAAVLLRVRRVGEVKHDGAQP
jgi:hypothetical protein